MTSKLLEHICCPNCHGPLILNPSTSTTSPALRHGALHCDNCKEVVGQLRFGKADFVHLKHYPIKQTKLNLSELSPPKGSFTYKRFAWNCDGITSEGMTTKDLGWTPEGFWGSLYGKNETPWSLTFETTAIIDLDIRCVSTKSTSNIDIFLDGEFFKTISPSNPGDGQIHPYEICRDHITGQPLEVAIKPSAQSKNEREFCVTGFDATLMQFEPTPLRQINRGNAFPATYEWAMDSLPADGLALDCSCGDRDFGDSRMIGLEYLPFELPHIFADGHNLPFSDETFDIVFSQAVMEHMKDPFVAAGEIARILKPGGLLYAESAFMQPLHGVPYHFFNTTPWGIEELFNTAGLKKHTVEWFGNLSGNLKWYLEVCGAFKKLDEKDLTSLEGIMGKVDADISYEKLKMAAGAVAIWAVKPGKSRWSVLLSSQLRPTYVY